MIPNYSSHIKKRYWEHIVSVFLVFRIYRKFFKFLYFDGTFSIPQKLAAFSFPPFLHHVAACFLRARMRGDWFTDCRDYEPVTKNELWVVRSIRPLFQMLCVHLFVSHSASTFTSQRRTCFVLFFKARLFSDETTIYRDPPRLLTSPSLKCPGHAQGARKQNPNLQGLNSADIVCNWIHWTLLQRLISMIKKQIHEMMGIKEHLHSE